MIRKVKGNVILKVRGAPRQTDMIDPTLYCSRESLAELREALERHSRTLRHTRNFFEEARAAATGRIASLISIHDSAAIEELRQVEARLAQLHLVHGHRKTP